MEITYMCADTGEKVICESLPKGWMIPSVDISADIPKDVLPLYFVLAFSSKEAQKHFVEKRVALGQLSNGVLLFV